MFYLRIKWPSTVDQAVTLLNEQLPDEELQRIATFDRDQLIDLDVSLGAWIRQQFGLRKGNDTLLECVPSADPDEATDAIILALWASLQAGGRRMH